jgi:hypothetical protein
MSQPDLKRFAERVLDAANYGDLDGGDLQEIAVECGVLREITVTEPCGEDCGCAEFHTTGPWTCYRRVPLEPSAPTASAQGWQPIETAPKDGTEVMLHGPEGLDVAEWHAETEDEFESGVIVAPGFDAGFFGRIYAAGCTEDPTHWQPLPPPPHPQAITRPDATEQS